MIFSLFDTPSIILHNVNMTQNQKLDRRTLYTINAIKDAFLNLIEISPYSKINVSAICKQAEISRATFYLHFESVDEVLDSVIDDALLFSEEGKGTIVDLVDTIHSSEAVLPACQRIADSKKYHSLFLQSEISSHIIQRLFSHEKEHVVPDFQKRSGLSREDAEILFQFILHGTFCVNTLLGWQKDEKWFRVQKMLSDFISAGTEDLKIDN